MKPGKKLLVLFGLWIVLTALFLLWNLTSQNIGYHLPRRLVKLSAICLTGGATAYSTVVFQIITGNRILTPSIMGLDSLYQLIQTAIILALGARQISMMTRTTDYLVSIVLMMVFSLFLFHIVFRRGSHRIFETLLIGMMMGFLFSGLASFFQVMIDPNEYLMVQARIFASFNNVNTTLLAISFLLMAVAVCYGWSTREILDVLSLGRDMAINLGVNYDRSVRRLMLLVAIMVSISTALIGPITFLGLLAANLSRQLLGTYRHSYLIPGAVLCALVALVGGQFLFERVFSFSTPISVIIHFFGGIYFLYLMIKESRL